MHDLEGYISAHRDVSESGTCGPGDGAGLAVFHLEFRSRRTGDLQSARTSKFLDRRDTDVRHPTVSIDECILFLRDYKDGTRDGLFHPGSGHNQRQAGSVQLSLLLFPFEADVVHANTVRSKSHSHWRNRTSTLSAATFPATADWLELMVDR